MEAGVDDQPAGPPHLVGEPAEVAVGIGVEARLQPQPLGIEAPALAEGRDVGEAPEIGQVLLLPRQGTLEMVSRHRFVQ